MSGIVEVPAARERAPSPRRASKVTDPAPWLGACYAGAVQETEVVDYRRRVAALYAEVRDGGADDPEGTWLRWRARRDELLATHPQSPVPPGARAGFAGIAFHPYDHRWRTEVEVEPLPGVDATAVPHSGSGGSDWVAVGRLAPGGPWGDATLTLLWLTSYGGGLFLPFRDTTNGTSSYGGGRYLLDTVKGADLGTGPGARVVLDANYAYHPSCAHDARWSCPLAPPQNRVDVAVEAGELLPSHGGHRG